MASPENPQLYPNEEPSAKRDPSILGMHVKYFIKRIIQLVNE